MRISVRYAAQARIAAGCSSEEFSIASPLSIKDFLAHIANQKSNGLRDLLIDSSGKTRTAVLVFVNDEQVQPTASQQINDGDQVEILSPISGG